MGQLYAITPFTQLDYPGELACIAWFSGCNLRCAYCHNPDIVLHHGQYDEDKLLSFLKRRQGLLTGVVFSGGEATFCPSLPALAQQAKAWGYKTKLDTNGTQPEMLHRLLEQDCITSIALDYKCPPHRAGAMLGTERYDAAFQESLAYLIEQSLIQKVQLEIRTTYHPDYLNEEDIGWIMGDLTRRGYQGTYWLQNIVTSGAGTLGKIEKPTKALNTQHFHQPKNIEIGYRNFTVRGHLI